jgi:hypothetical protein
MSNDRICSFNWRMIERYKVNPIRLENTGGGVGQIGKAMIAIVDDFQPAHPDLNPSLGQYFGPGESQTSRLNPPLKSPRLRCGVHRKGFSACS